MKKFYLEMKLKDGDSCKGCRMRRQGYAADAWYCEETGYDIVTLDRPAWCPLKEVGEG
jgi:hypothetical protein